MAENNKIPRALYQYGKTGQLLYDRRLFVSISPCVLRASIVILLPVELKFDKGRTTTANERKPCWGRVDVPVRLANTLKTSEV